MQDASKLIDMIWMEKMNITGIYILPNLPRVDSCPWEVDPLPSMPAVHWLSRFVFHLTTEESPHLSA